MICKQGNTCPKRTHQQIIIIIRIIKTKTKQGLLPGPCCFRLTVYGNGAQAPIKIKVSMVVTIDGKVTINGKFCATGQGILIAAVEVVERYLKARW